MSHLNRLLMTSLCKQVIEFIYPTPGPCEKVIGIRLLRRKYVEDNEPARNNRSKCRVSSTIERHKMQFAASRNAGLISNAASDF